MLKEKGIDVEIQTGQKVAAFSLGVYMGGGGGRWGEGSSAYRICIS